MSADSPLPLSFQIPPQRPVDHFWNVTTPRPATLTIDGAGIELVYANGKQRRFGWADENLVVFLLDYSAAVADVQNGKGVLSWQAKNYPYQVMFKPTHDNFWLPKEVWDALHMACRSAGLPFKKGQLDPRNDPPGLEVSVNSRIPTASWFGWPKTG